MFAKTNSNVSMHFNQRQQQQNMNACEYENVDVCLLYFSFYISDSLFVILFFLFSFCCDVEGHEWFWITIINLLFRLGFSCCWYLIGKFHIKFWQLTQHILCFISGFKRKFNLNLYFFFFILLKWSNGGICVLGVFLYVFFYAFTVVVVVIVITL